METEFDSPIVAAAVAYARLGWRVIPVRGKVPAGGPGWPDRATRDPGEAVCLFEDVDHDGVGVVLGPTSDLIDFDCDSDAAEETLQRLFDGQIPPTPTYQSTKGLHRLFRWSDEMPPSELKKAKFVVDGLEIRIGGGANAAQTVFPPSGGRSWVVSPEECEVAEVPPTVLERLAARVAELRRPKPLQAAPAVPTGPQLLGDDRLNVPRWLARHNVPILGTDEGKDGARRWFIRCPGIEAHTGKNAAKDCVVTQESDGRLGGCCFHTSCGMNSWPQLRDAIGPLEASDYREPAAIDEAAIAGILAGAVEPAGVEDDDQAEDEPEDGDDLGEAGYTGKELPESCRSVPGLIDEIVGYTLATSLYPQPELALAGALALLGTVTGRKVTDCFGTRTNVYVLGLGLSGTGKEHARKVSKELLLRCGGEAMIGSERIGSHAGIVTTIHEQPASLMQLDEMGRLLETMKDPKRSPHLYNCITVLMQLYSSSGTLWKADAYADAKKVKTIDQPHLCIYGTATPDSFWRSLSTDNIAEGLIGRLLVLEGRGYELEMQTPEALEPGEALVRDLRAWVDYQPGGNLSSEHPRPQVVQHTPEARERFLGHIKGINAKRKTEGPLRAAVWSRSGEKVAKLALLHACSRARGVPPFVEWVDVDWAVRLGNWFTRRLLAGCRDHVAENEVEARAKRVLAIIGDAGVTSRTLSRRTQWLRSRERDEIVRDLMACGLVELCQETSGGRPRSVFRRVKKCQKDFRQSSVKLTSIRQ